MFQRPLSRDSIELSRLSPRPPSPVGDLNISSVSRQALLEPPTECRPEYHSSDGAAIAPSLHESGVSPHSSSPKPLRFWHRIGIKGLLVVIVGSLLLIASTFFLCFLWFEAEKAREPEDVESQEFWLHIVLTGWTTRTVTITAAIIRSVMTLQTTVVDAMVAAIIFESTGVPLSQLSLMSIARATNISPLDLAIPVTINLRNSPKSVWLPLAIIIPSCLLAIGSQFISTILLSDFGRANIAVPPNSSNITMPYSAFSIEPWNSAPKAFWRFAEYREENKSHKTPPHVVDTGRAIRAAIPWPDKNSRINLRSYAGMAPVWDARVICYSPTLKNSSFKIELSSPSMVGMVPATDGGGATVIPTDRPYVDAAHPSTTIMPSPSTTDLGLYTSITTYSSVTTYNSLPTSIVLQGSVSYDEPSFPLAPGTYQLGPDYYNCKMDWRSQFSVCFAGFSSTIDSLVTGALGTPNSSSERSGGYIVFARKSRHLSATDMKTVNNATFTLGHDATDWSARREGPWTTVSNSSGHSIFAMSYCVDGGSDFYYVNVTMKGTSSKAEPTIKWTQGGHTSTGFADTSQVRMQLGATRENLSPQDRGLVSLRLPKIDALGIPVLGSGFDSLSGLNYCLAFDAAPRGAKSNVHDMHSLLFGQVMNDTHNPAAAMLALSTVFSQMTFFDMSHIGSAKSFATYVIAQDVFIPTTNGGLMIGITIVVTHLAILGVTMLLFLRRTEVTMIGNAWQTVAQVVSDDTSPILDRAVGLQDKEVKKIIEGSDEAREVVGVIRRRQDGRVRFGRKKGKLAISFF